MFNRDVNGLGQSKCLGNRHHVRQRHHHFSRDSVSKFNDRLNQIALFFLDDIVVHRSFNDSEQFLFADERALFKTLSFHDDIGQ